MSRRSDSSETPEGVSLLRTHSSNDFLPPSRTSTANSTALASPVGSHLPFFSEKQEEKDPWPLITAIATVTAKTCVVAKRMCARRASFIKSIIMTVGAITLIIVIAVLGSKRQPHPAHKPKPPPHWGAYPFLDSYFNGVFNLVNRSDNVPEWPPSDKKATRGDQSTRFKFAKSKVFRAEEKWAPDAIECSWSDYDEDDEVKVGRTRERPLVRRFDGIPAGLPNTVMGSHSVLGLDDNVCYERYGRFAPYGVGYSSEEGGMGVSIREEWMDLGGEIYEGGYWAGALPVQKIDWRGVKWGKLQERCVQKNKARFWQPPRTLGLNDTLAHLPIIATEEPTEEEMEGKVPRTAILIRVWNTYKYSENDVINLRALISEASLMSGGQYQVFLLVHVKDQKIPIFTHPDIYRNMVNKSVPEEFRDIAILWNENLSRFVYNDLPLKDRKPLPVHGVYRASFMPVTIFAQQHPEFQFIYNWELDVRSTDHYLDLLATLDKWGQDQPRDHLWERSGRFYIPVQHGSWENFTSMVEQQYPKNESIWGPVPVEGVVPLGPKAPERSEKNWGVGEQADLITFGPLFNVHHTNWILRDDLVGYPPETPARATIVAHSRMSRRLMKAMHTEMGMNQRMITTEMIAPTVALHHGFKAMSAPHPIYFDRNWPTSVIDPIFNAGPGGETGNSRETVFGEDFQHNFKGASWYYNSAWSEVLYRRWVGETVSSGGGRDWEREHGRMCLPAMMFHPIKKVEMK